MQAWTGHHHRPSEEARTAHLSITDGCGSLARVYNECGGRQSGSWIRFAVASHQDFKYQLKKRFLHRNTVPCANSFGNVYLTPTYDSACNLASSGASCGVSELHFSGWDRLLHQTVHIRWANTATAVPSAPQNVSPTAQIEIVRNALDSKM